MVAALPWEVSSCGASCNLGRNGGHLVAAAVVEPEKVTPLWVGDPLAESQERRQSISEVEVFFSFFY